MKIVVILMSMIYSLMAADAAAAAKLLGYETDYRTALTTAKQENKMVLMVIVQEPCPYCDRLVKETMSTKCVQRRMKHYVPLIVDKHSDYPQQFKPPMIPMSFVVDPESEEVTFEIVGALPFKEYIHDLETEIEFRDIEESGN
jgi:thioredoxin-related protein